MTRKISHIGIAVKDLEQATKLFSRLLEIKEVPTEEVPDQKVKLAFFYLEDSSLELTQATAPDSPIQRFIEKYGEGIHHLSIQVQDINAEIARLKQQGFRLIDERPRIGAGGTLIAFIHPASTNGVLIEICQEASKLQNP
jgi:methylmalonyl-CoA/ethylmalonyl-CoA epimerase